MTVKLEVRTAKIGEAWVAGVTLAGINIRGKRADTEHQAVRALLWTLADQANDDAATALELAVNGQTIDDAFGKLTAGD